MGTLRHQTIGSLNYKAPSCNLEATINFGTVKGKQQDYFTGEIKVRSKVASRVYGTYLGFAEFDGVRYWDARDFKPLPLLPSERTLPSDSRHRPDLQTLALGDVPNAQKRKEELEHAQRKDAKLRAEAQKAARKCK